MYPRAFSQRICEGIAAEKKLRRPWMIAMPLMSLESDRADGTAASDALYDPDDTQAFAEQSSDPLMPALVRKVRQEEMAYFCETRVYEKVGTGERVRATSKRPIAVRWVDMNKGDSAQPSYRSRLAAKEFRGNDDRPEW